MNITSVNQRSVIDGSASLRDTLAAIDAGAHGIAFVNDDAGVLLGILTQFEVRKALLGGARLEDGVGPFINRAPVVAPAAAGREELYRVITTTGKNPIPLVDAEGRVTGVVSLQEILGSREPAPARTAVIIAGGLGTRLLPLTEQVPKPLLSVGGDRSILQITIEELRRHGFTRIFLSVHYKAEMIEEQLLDGSAMGVEINYLRETTPLGTAGGLSLLPERPSSAFVVVNGDLLTRVSFADLHAHHRECGEAITVAVRRHETRVPYGVIRLDGQRIVGVDEKPVHTCLVNAGIYAMNPEVLELLAPAERVDMPVLVERAIRKWGHVGSFLVHEYWRDVGGHEDLIRATRDYPDLFV